MREPHGETVIDARTKGAPPALWGMRVAEAGDAGLGLADLPTPLLAFDRAAGDANTRLVADWAAARGLELAPHGKTTMSPVLWRRLLDAGATAITLATPWQVQAARSAGVRRVILANELLDPSGAAWIAGELDRDPDFRFACWVDSPEGVALLDRVAGASPIDVLVELGGPGGRAGVRELEDAVAIARLARAAAGVRLVGVAGYEGSFGGARTEEAAASVRGYLARLVELLERLRAEELLEASRPVITAGGSAWPDLVAEALAPLAARATGAGGARAVLRSGAFQVHDDGFYAGISPFAGSADGGAPHLVPALRAYARVLSRPEPGLAILDAGRRDLSYDLDLPIPLHRDGRRIDGWRVTGLNDQHAYLELPADAALRPGDVVELGISHPCTAIDRWRVLPELDDARAASPRLVGMLETWF
ncbi:alanine racemase [Homoserinibacter sp. YIM 151385]|uniref:alanine racemase n=1 Tax=Homoserinibacter sp. YIM 151385 TaxID=2985506 RepID=UPI0022EFE39C|nr:alanine racemase [Homoserinibacter sp. YIM 151385]WBU37832.1 alanine racemase [Homoserinibacter sp. YIM 151385]